MHKQQVLHQNLVVVNTQKTEDGRRKTEVFPLPSSVFGLPTFLLQTPALPVIAMQELISIRHIGKFEFLRVEL